MSRRDESLRQRLSRFEKLRIGLEERESERELSTSEKIVYNLILQKIDEVLFLIQTPEEAMEDGE